MRWLAPFCYGFLLINLAARPAKTRPGRWVVTKSSSLSIAGRTNINRFNCDVARYVEPDTIDIVGDVGDGQSCGVALTGNLRLAIATFNCHNRAMTADLKRTLRADSYPELIIQFISLERLPVFGSLPDRVHGRVGISLAGITRQLTIDYEACSTDDSVLQLTGRHEVHFSEFGLQAPRKMGGLIKVDDRLTVTFRLCLETI